MAYDPTVPTSPSPGPGYTWNPVYATWVSTMPQVSDSAPQSVLDASRQAMTNTFLQQGGAQPGQSVGDVYQNAYSQQAPGQGTQAYNNGGMQPAAPAATTNAGTGTTPGNSTLGALASGGTGTTPGNSTWGNPSTTPSTGTDTGTAANSADPTAGLAMSSFQNPMAQTMQDWANKALQSSYGAAGNFLSGPAMQGITQYNQQAALNNSFQPAVQDYLANNQQQYNQALNDQTIPFNQQLQLAQLGLQGQQGSSSLASILAGLISGNTTALGQAQAGGTIGGSNAINGSIQAIINQLLQQNTLNRVLPTTGGG